MPENPSWIKNADYKQLDENSLEVYYHDSILDSDCKLSVAKDTALVLSENTYDEALSEVWEGNTTSGQTVYVKVQHSADGKTMLATWEYDNYKFAIQGDVPNDITDTSSIPKTALSVIDNFE